MSFLITLRDRLDRLEDSLAEAGLVLLQAEQTESPADLNQLLTAYGLSSQNRSRLRWLREHGETLRWYRDQKATGGNSDCD